MPKFQSQTYTIADVLEWSNRNQLELSPRFQRRAVWNDNARSYLMDTIVRGKPIPKLFIRQRIDPLTKSITREVVDGQQRLRTILSYLRDEFVIKRAHNEQYGSYYYSQLSQVDEDIQVGILSYQLAVDLLVNMPDSEVLDIFSRLNTYAVVLNEMERINANHFGPFKTLTDRLGHHYYEFWLANRILTDAQILRMAEDSLVADLLIAMVEGIKTKKQIKYYYDHFEADFRHDVDTLEMQFHDTMATISGIFTDSLRSSEFRRVHLFYSLFTAIYHMKYGLPHLGLPRRALNASNYPRANSALHAIDDIFDAAAELIPLPADREQFLTDSRRATTDAAVRVRRTSYLVSLLLRGLSRDDSQ